LNLLLLIDSIVRQTTVLIAQLATAHGVRAPLAHVANQVFLNLSNELNEQGVSRKVSADMFGMALRTYLRKIQRISESTTDGGRSLWEAVLAYLDQGKVVTRAQVLQRFHRDDAELVRGVLHDLCESGLVFRTGSGASTAYRVAAEDEIRASSASEADAGHDEFIWALVYREGPLTADALAKRVRSKGLETTLERLVSSGRVQKSETEGSATYSAREFFVPRDASAGWEAAVFDHFQAMVRTILAKLAAGSDAPGTRVGGSNAAHPKPKRYSNVTLYAGQCVIEEDDSEAP
jgi:hypothetical protein